MDISHWAKPHFCTYIFLCIASADDKVDLSELKNIQNFLERMHIESKESIVVINEVKSLFNSQKEAERIEFIKTAFIDFFITKQQTAAIVDEIEDLILIDNSIEKKEIQMYSKIRKALDIND